MKLARRALLATGLALPAAAAARLPDAPAVERFALWPGAPPGGEGLAVKDEVVKRSPNGPEDDIAWPHVGTPMLTHLTPAQPNGAALLLVPGGSYSRVAVGRTGSAQARMFAAHGFHVFELLYRLPHDGWAAGPDAPLQDGQRALRVIRAGAKRWGIDSARVGAIGFSAGGHLTARLGSRSALASYAPVDETDRESARPALVGLFFPVITMVLPDAHGVSRRELIGRDPDVARVQRYSAENDLPTDMPPTFLAHAANDPTVPCANSLRMFAALQAARIPSELMVFEKGGHGLQPQDPWVELFLTFAARHGLTPQ